MLFHDSSNIAMLIGKRRRRKSGKTFIGESCIGLMRKGGERDWWNLVLKGGDKTYRELLALADEYVPKFEAAIDGASKVGRDIPDNILRDKDFLIDLRDRINTAYAEYFGVAWRAVVLKFELSTPNDGPREADVSTAATNWSIATSADSAQFRARLESAGQDG